MNKKSKVALFGGSFDPFHKSHLEIINWCKNNLDFESIWVILAYQNPFKAKVFSTVEQRKEIIELATNELEYVKLIDYELKKQKQIPTYKTVRYLKSKYPKIDFTFIIGMDILADFEKWYNYDKLLKMVKFKVFKRDGYDYEEVAKRLNIDVIDFDNSQLSSTNIRNEISLEYQLSIVNRYVKNNFLYYDNKLLNNLTEKSFNKVKTAIEKFENIFDKKSKEYLLYKNALLVSYTCFDWKKSEIEKIIKEKNSSWELNSENESISYLYASYYYMRDEIITENFYNKNILHIIHNLARTKLDTKELSTLFDIIEMANKE